MLTVLAFNLVADGLRDSLGRERPTGSSPVADERGPRRSALARLGSTSRSGLEAVTAPRSARQRRSSRSETCGIEFLTRQEWLPVMEDADFSVPRGKTLGLVGESGSGKTVSALAVMGLLPAKVSRVSGSIRFDGQELTSLSPAGLRKLRGNEIAMIFQEPMTSLNPAFTVGNQIAEQVRAHREISRADAWKVAVEMLDRVEIPHAATRAQDYPHAFSGGMRQRVMIAMALSCSPKLLIADEPTTALDVTTQSQIIELLHSLQREEDMAMIFVTHDLGVIADVAADVRGHVRRTDRRACDGNRSLRSSPTPVHRSPSRLDPTAHPEGRAVARHPGHGAACRTSFRSAAALRLRCSYVQDACTAAPVSCGNRPGSDGGPTGRAAAGRSGVTSLAVSARTSSSCPAWPTWSTRPRRARRAGPEPADDYPDRRCSKSTDLVMDFPLRSGVLRRTTGSGPGG